MLLLIPETNPKSLVKIGSSRVETRLISIESQPKKVDVVVFVVVVAFLGVLLIVFMLLLVLFILLLLWFLLLMILLLLFLGQ